MHAHDEIPSGPKQAWLERFARSVRTFDPSLDELVARGLAESEFSEAGHLEPEEAAEAYATRESEARTPAARGRAASTSLADARKAS